MIILLRIIRGIIGFLFAIAFIGTIDALVTIIMLLTKQYAYEAGVVTVIFGVKLIASIILVLIFFGMRTLINKIYIKKTGQNVPVLVKRWSL